MCFCSCSLLHCEKWCMYRDGHCKAVFTFIYWMCIFSMLSNNLILRGGPASTICHSLETNTGSLINFNSLMWTFEASSSNELRINFTVKSETEWSRKTLWTTFAYSQILWGRMNRCLIWFKVAIYCFRWLNVSGVSHHSAYIKINEADMRNYLIRLYPSLFCH